MSVSVFLIIFLDCSDVLAVEIDFICNTEYNNYLYAQGIIGFADFLGWQ